MLRRDFLKFSAGTTGLTLLPLGAQGWAASNPAGGRRRLVVVFLRGAVDGLNVVVPYGDSAYYDARPTIAIQPPGSAGGALELDGRFGLHPALAPLLPFWRERSLAFIHASGSPDPTRSHFTAQDYMESGTPGRSATRDGWMNRLLSALPGAHQSTSAVSFGPTLPRILSGRMSVANVPLGRGADHPLPIDRPVINASFDRLYAGNDPMSRAYKEGMAMRAKLMADLETDMVAADNGAPSPVGFSSDTEHLARLVARDPAVELAFFALGGWDTHVNEGAAEGQLAGHLRPLAEGLSALAKGIGPAYRDTVILVVSEFGRTVRENGNRGTDHGHGNVMWVMGGPVAGGRVYGAWPSLAEDALYQNRDLAITTDYRSAIAVVLERHLRLGGTALRAVFPGAPPPPATVGGLIRV